MREVIASKRYVRAPVRVGARRSATPRLAAGATRRVPCAEAEAAGLVATAREAGRREASPTQTESGRGGGARHQTRRRAIHSRGWGEARCECLECADARAAGARRSRTPRRRGSGARRFDARPRRGSRPTHSRGGRNHRETLGVATPRCSVVGESCAAREGRRGRDSEHNVRRHRRVRKEGVAAMARLRRSRRPDPKHKRARPSLSCSG